MVEAIHTAVNGRARFKVKPLYRSEPVKRLIESNLSTEEGIDKISASTLTGTVLVLFNSGNTPARISRLIETLVSEHEREVEEKKTTGPAGEGKSAPAPQPPPVRFTWNLPARERDRSPIGGYGCDRPMLYYL